MSKNARHSTRSVKKEIKTDNAFTIFILGSIIFVFAYTLYSNTLKHDYVYDDFSVLKENRIVKNGINGLSDIFTSSYRHGSLEKSEDLYRPLSLAMFAIEWELSPDNPVLSHFMNILLYAITVLCLFLTLRKIFSKFNIVFPFIICILFSAHPIHTEVVANIKSRDEIMSFLFMVLSLKYLWEYLNNKLLKNVIISVCLYFFALLSKESAVMFVLIVPLIIYFFTNVSLKENLKTAAFFLIPLILILLLRNSVIGNFATSASPSEIDNILIAAPDLFSRYATAMLILGKYLAKLFFPYSLVSDYSFNQIPIVPWSNFSVIASLITYSGMLIFSLIAIKGKNIYSFIILLFLITISVYSNLFLTIGSSFGERFLYLPSLAFCIGIAYFILVLFKTDLQSVEIPGFQFFLSKFKNPLLISGALVLFYSFKTYSRNAEWESNYSLYSADVKRSPESARLHFNYGVSLLNKVYEATSVQQKQQFETLAIYELKKAITIYPKYAEAHERLASVFLKQENNTEALKHFELALQYDPGRAITYSNIGMIYFNKGQFKKAIDFYSKAVSLDSSFADAYMNLGSSYGMLKDYEKAIECFRRCLSLQPDNANAKRYLELAIQMNNKMKQQ
ncbi:MAG: bacteriophage receptor-2C outer rane subunit [Bacteroidetes bacterium]|jgi:tetratricopeptide (TPR) repeat protein|nr:bacteriophage receptor-2C outer rane subunit [Bacteroidota bacterium]